MLRNSCWICGCWREIRFTYLLTDADIIRCCANAAPPSPDEQLRLEADMAAIAAAEADLAASPYLDAESMMRKRQHLAGLRKMVIGMHAPLFVFFFLFWGA